MREIYYSTEACEEENQRKIGKAFPPLFMGLPGLFVCLNGCLPGGRKVGIPLGILLHVWEQNKCSYFSKPGQS